MKTLEDFPAPLQLVVAAIMGAQVEPHDTLLSGMRTDSLDQALCQALASCLRGDKHTGQPGPEFRPLGKVVPGRRRAAEQFVVIQGDQALPVAPPRSADGDPSGRDGDLAPPGRPVSDPACGSR